MEHKRQKTDSPAPPSGARAGMVMGLPIELTHRILLSSMGDTPKAQLMQLKNFRLVSRECNALATDMLLEQYIAYLEKVVEGLTAQISGKWNEQPGEEEGARLTASFNAVSQVAEELSFLKRKVDEKREARQTIFRMDSIDSQTKLQLLKACAFDSEFLTLRGIAVQVANERKELQQQREPSSFDPLAVPGPLGGPFPLRPPPGYPPLGPAPPFFGEPTPDHLPPPEWERDRNPPGWHDPSSPFHFPDPYPNPFNPMGGRGGGRGGGGGWQPRFI